MNHTTLSELIGLDFALLDDCVYATTELESHLIPSKHYESARAIYVSEYLLDEYDLVLKIHCAYGDNTPFSLEVFPQTFDFLTHLINGAELRHIRPSQSDVLISGVVTVLAAWRKEQQLDGAVGSPNGDWFERALWFLEQPCSSVCRYDSQLDLLYLKP